MINASENTFWEIDGEDVEHVHGGRWSAFIADTGTFFNEHLGEAIADGRVVGLDVEQVKAGASPKGVYIGHDMGDARVLALVEIKDTSISKLWSAKKCWASSPCPKLAMTCKAPLGCRVG